MIPILPRAIKGTSAMTTHLTTKHTDKYQAMSTVPFVLTQPLFIPGTSSSSTSKEKPFTNTGSFEREHWDVNEAKVKK